MNSLRIERGHVVDALKQASWRQNHSYSGQIRKQSKQTASGNELSFGQLLPHPDIHAKEKTRQHFPLLRGWIGEQPGMPGDPALSVKSRWYRRVCGKTLLASHFFHRSVRKGDAHCTCVITAPGRLCAKAFPGTRSGVYLVLVLWISF